MLGLLGTHRSTWILTDLHIMHHRVLFPCRGSISIQKRSGHDQQTPSQIFAHFRYLYDMSRHQGYKRILLYLIWNIVYRDIGSTFLYQDHQQSI